MAKLFQLKPKHRILMVLVTVQVGLSIDKMVLPIAMPYIAADYQLSPIAMGAVMSAFFASYSLSQIPGGILADRFGVRIVASLALLWSTMFAGLASVAANLTQLMVARLGAGLGEGVYPACTYKAISAWFPSKSRASATSAVLAFANVGGALAPLIVVPIILMWGWRAVFMLLAAVGLIASISFWKLVRNRPDPVAGPTPIDQICDTNDATVVSALENQPLANKVAVRASVISWFMLMFTFDFAVWGYKLWLPTFLVQARGFSGVEMAGAMSACSLAGVAGSFCGGWLSDNWFRNHRRILIIISLIASAVSIYMTFHVTSSTALYAWLLIAGFFLLLFFPAYWALPLNMLGEGRMGASTGLLNMAGQIAAFIAPVTMGYLMYVSGGSYEFAFTVLAAVSLVSCVFVFFPTARFMRKHGGAPAGLASGSKP